MRPQRLTFESVKESIKQKTTEKNRTYFGKDFIVVTNNNHLLSHMLLQTNPVTLHYTMLGFVSTGKAVFTVNLLKNHLYQGNIVVLNPDERYISWRNVPTISLSTYNLSDE